MSSPRKQNRRSESDGSRWQDFRFGLLYGLFSLIGLLPWWFLYYPLAELVYVLLYYVARYRVKVTRDNLTKAFPEKERKELRRLERRYYRQLAEVFVDTIDLTSISPRALRRRMVFRDEEAHRRLTEGKDWISAMAHYGSWEYVMSYALGDTPDRETVGVYKPLSDKVMDRVYRRMRSRVKMIPVPKAVFLRHIIGSRRKGIHMTIGMIADQAPPRMQTDYWIDFLGRPTAFYDGMETIATRFGIPIYFMHVAKTRRAHYEAWFECIYDGSEPVAPHEITRRYAALLEQMIRQRPELWVWSHKRWKWLPTPEQLEQQKAAEACHERS